MKFYSIYPIFKSNDGALLPPFNPGEGAVMRTNGKSMP